MNRRDAVLALAVFGAAPFGAKAQQTGKVFRIGYLSAPTRKSVELVLEAFQKALRELGWIEGQNLIIEYRWAEGKVERLPELAADLVRLKVDLIVAPAGSAALAAKKATNSIPVVMIFPDAPVEMGLVSSLRRPGGNVTGTTSAPGPEIFSKQLQLLMEVIPRASRLVFLFNPENPGYANQLKEVDATASSQRIHIQRVEVRKPEDFDGAFAVKNG